MSGRSSSDRPLPSNGEIIRSGVLKKMKTSRKKYFVLRAETPDAMARLEYYDSEKKFRAGLPPKRVIALRTCFNINKKSDTKQKNVIALYTKDDCFCIVLDSEEDLKIWLKDLLTLQHGMEIEDGVPVKPKFGKDIVGSLPEYIWQVNVCDRGLGVGRTGAYRLCLSDKTITLVKVDEAIPTVIKLPLISVRRSGNLKNFFFLEVGRMSEIGAGEVWFEAEDTNIALNIQTTVSHRFKIAREKEKEKETTTESGDLQPESRTRSASATESSKSTNKKFGLFMTAKHAIPQDSSTSDSTLTPSVTTASSSIATTGGGSIWSAGANHQRTQSLPLAAPITATPPTINSTATDNTNNICLTHHHLSNKKGQSTVGGGKCSFRERCDSMPTRPPRTISEGNHGIPGFGKPYLVPYRHHLRDASHSPPTGSPISPPSDSTGSSYSLPDEHDGPHEMEHQRMYSTLTPDEVIAEEDDPESPRADPPGGPYVPMNLQGATESNYTEMSSGGQYAGNTFASSSASMSSVTSGTPSTDIRLSEYPLDKVCSYVSADDDDARPCRTYSVGSKPPEAQLASTPENARVRAFSVGSKTKKYFNRVLPAHHYPPGVKSSSAPLLGPISRMGSSHGSINNPMDDLMEMDFTCNDTSRSRSSTNASGSSDSRSSCNHRNSSCSSTKGKIMGFLGSLVGYGSDKKNTSDGYVEMKPGVRPVRGESTPYVDMTQGQRTIRFPEMGAGLDVPPIGHPLSPYLDMSGSHAAARDANVPLVGHPYSPYLDMSGNHASIGGVNTPHVGNGDSPYMDMSGGTNAAAAATANEDYFDMSGSSPVQISPRPSSLTMGEYGRQFNPNASRTANSPGAWNSDINTDYLDMSGGRNRRPERTSSFGSQMSSSPHYDLASARHVDQHLPYGVHSRILEGSARDIEGYVEMTPGEVDAASVRHQRQSSTDSASGYGHHDYLNVEGVEAALARSERTGRSQPIAIQTAPGSSTLVAGGRKLSPTVGGSPKMHLPLSPYSSLPRQKAARKQTSQAGSSKDSSLSSSVTTTPSSSSTMFPLSLNSPSSPLGAPSKTGTPATSAMKVPASVLNVPYKSSGAKKKTHSEDYTMMDLEAVATSFPLEASRVEESPYMNYCPSGAVTTRPTRLATPEKDDHAGDYAVMKPGGFSSKSGSLPRLKGVAPSPGAATLLADHLYSVGLSDRQCFMPIREKDERMCSPKPGDVPEKVTQDEKSLETANMECEDDSSRPYDRLKSPAGGAQVQRPASTTGLEKPSSRPSSVCSEGLTSRLGSNSSVYSSSSSTSTVVGASSAAKSDQPDTDQPQQQSVRLHYASLDLSAASGDPTEERRSPRNVKSASSSEASLGEGQVSTFVYADIDFVRSEELNKSGGQGGAAVSSSSGGSGSVKN